MAQAAYAYSEPLRREQQAPVRPDLRVLPGTGARQASQAGLSPQLRALFGVLIFAVLFLSAVCLARVALANITLQTLIDTQALHQATAEERSRGLELEVQYSIATNPDLIQTLAAEQLGMAPDEQVEYLRPLAGE